MGNSIQHIAENIRLVASEKSWIEGKAIQQLTTTAQLQGIQQAVGLPDLHPGKGYPIGASFLTTQWIYPALVGSDIGCGMAFWQTEFKLHKVHLDKFEKKLRHIGEPLDDDWQPLIRTRQQALALHTTDFDASLGTIGGGNHFAELQKLHQIHDEAAFAQTSFDAKALQLLVHSGSRGFGQSILQEHVNQWGHQGLVADSAAGIHYLTAQQQALCFAKLNRELIALRIMASLSTEGHCLSDVFHNFVQDKGAQGWLHRKGATPSDQGLVLIPGSRGDLSYLVKPNPSESSLWSLAHGAGRKWIRSECKGRLSAKHTTDELSRSRFGSRLLCDNKALLFEEAPAAYKAIDQVIADLQNAGLIQIIASFAPVLTVKLQGRCC